MADHIERVKAEKYELDVKRNALNRFFITSIFKELDQAEKDRLRTQHSVMGVYSEILGQRIAASKPD